MNIAIIIAGGSGVRMGQDIPKQFLNVYDKPVIVYTLEAFQQHPLIDAIEVVCIDGWHDVLKAYCKQFGISKFENVVAGGTNGQESIHNGVADLLLRHNGDDIVLIHDAIRPMVTAEIITNCIHVCQQCGNAITVIPCAEAMLLTADGKSADDQIARTSLKRTQTPQAFYLKDLADAHAEAQRRGITNSIASCTLFVELGRKVYFSEGAEKNVKLTTPEDIEIFKALLKSENSKWIK